VCSCRCWRSCRARIAAASRLLQRCREATPAVAGSPSPTASYAFRPWVFESTSGRSEAQQQRRDLLQTLASRRSTLRCYPGQRVRFCSRLWQVRVFGAGQERPYRPMRPQPVIGRSGQMGPVSPRRTSLRRTASFTPSMQSFCPRTGNCWPPRPDDCLARSTIVHWKAPFAGPSLLNNPCSVVSPPALVRGAGRSGDFRSK